MSFGRLKNEKRLPVHQLYESRRIASCTLAYLRAHHAEIGAAFELLSILEAPTSVDFSFLLDAYRDEFTASFTAAEKTRVCCGAGSRLIRPRSCHGRFTALAPRPMFLSSA